MEQNVNYDVFENDNQLKNSEIREINKLIDSKSHTELIDTINQNSELKAVIENDYSKFNQDRLVFDHNPDFFSSRNINLKTIKDKLSNFGFDLEGELGNEDFGVKTFVAIVEFQKLLGHKTRGYIHSEQIGYLFPESAHFLVKKGNTKEARFNKPEDCKKYLDNLVSKNEGLKELKEKQKTETKKEIKEVKNELPKVKKEKEAINHVEEKDKNESNRLERVKSILYSKVDGLPLKEYVENTSNKELIDALWLLRDPKNKTSHNEMDDFELKLSKYRVNKTRLEKEESERKRLEEKRLEEKKLEEEKLKKERQEALEKQKEIEKVKEKERLNRVLSLVKKENKLMVDYSGDKKLQDAMEPLRRVGHKATHEEMDKFEELFNEYKSQIERKVPETKVVKEKVNNILKTAPSQEDLDKIVYSIDNEIEREEKLKEQQEILKSFRLKGDLYKYSNKHKKEVPQCSATVFATAKNDGIKPLEYQTKGDKYNYMDLVLDTKKRDRFIYVNNNESYDATIPSKIIRHLNKQEEKEFFNNPSRLLYKNRDKDVIFEEVVNNINDLPNKLKDGDKVIVLLEGTSQEFGDLYAHQSYGKMIGNELYKTDGFYEFETRKDRRAPLKFSEYSWKDNIIAVIVYSKEDDENVKITEKKSSKNKKES